jgi:RNA polymerase sigma-70 factor, ECF subfamily
VNNWHKLDDTWSDADLIEATLAGRLDAFDILVTRYRNVVYRYLAKNINLAHAAEDLAQDTFISAYQKLSSFKGESKFSTWLIGIALNIVRNYSNRSEDMRYDKVSTDHIAERFDENDNPQKQLAKKNLRNSMQDALNQLPKDLREILIMVSMEGVSYEEVSKMLNLPVGTVKSKLFRAREQLRKTLQLEKHQ